MQNDPYAPLPRGRLVAWATFAVVVMLLGALALVMVGIPISRVLLGTAMLGIITLGAVGGALWIAGGKRSPQGVGPANIRLPIRLQKALPFIIAASICYSLFQLFEAIGSIR